ncbi:unnamed protein product [Prunus armeniaca]
MDNARGTVNEPANDSATPPNNKPASAPSLTSKVWSYFKRVNKIENGKLVLKAECVICNTLFAGSPRSGTSHLSRHLKEHEAAQARISPGHVLLNADVAGNLTNFAYDHAVARKEVVDFIVRAELPFKFVESHDFTGMIQRAFCPQYRGISASTCKGDVIKKFVWSSQQKMGYMSLTAHFIDKDWCLNKRDALTEMKAKFDKYWEEFPTVFCFATIMDPRFKVFAIGEWLNMIGIDQLTIDSKLLALKTLLFQFFDVYKRSVMSHVGQNVQSANVTSSTLSQTPGSIVVPIMQNFSMQCLKRAKLSSSSSSTTKSELEVYLDVPTIDVADDNQFSVLGWWKKNQSLYPIVSLMARDLLTIPASTVASESCFSAGGKVLSEKWTNVSPNTIEALICLKDWALANSRMQDPAQDEQRAEELMNIRASRSDWMAASETVESESENETIES